MDLARGIGGKKAVLGQRAVADHPIQADFTPCGGGHTELRSGQRLAGGAVPLLDDQLTFRLVLKGQADRPPLFDLHRLGLGINNEPRRGLGLRNHHALAGGQPFDPDLAVSSVLKMPLLSPIRVPSA